MASPTPSISPSTPSLRRRGALGALGTLGALGLISCGGGGSDSSTGNLSADATLSALALSVGSLSPAFSAGTSDYAVTVTNAVSSITVTPTASDAGATITVAGADTTSGAASSAITLAVGSNTIAVVVTAADGSTTRTYDVTVARASASSGGNCALIPTETEGPYPLLAILGNSAMVRSDITEGKAGVPLTLTLTLENLDADCAGIAGAAIYVWHCDKDGAYSGYSNTANGGHTGETFLRGIQLTDANGQVTFTTIYPGWYTGRITHIHVQAYLNDNLAVTATLTTQLAFPQDVTTAVYASSLYASHGQNTSVASFAADGVFSDGTSLQMATITGDTASGYAAALTLGIAA